MQHHMIRTTNAKTTTRMIIQSHVQMDFVVTVGASGLRLFVDPEFWCGTPHSETSMHLTRACWELAASYERIKLSNPSAHSCFAVIVGGGVGLVGGFSDIATQSPPVKAVVWLAINSRLAMQASSSKQVSVSAWHNLFKHGSKLS